MSDMVLYASDESDAALSEARVYCKTHGLTADDVKLVRRDNQILVIDRATAWQKMKQA